MSLQKIRAVVAPSVIKDICRDHGCTPADLVAEGSAHRHAKAQLYRSFHDAGFTFQETANIVGRQTSTIYRVVQRAYPADFPGRSGKA